MKSFNVHNQHQGLLKPQKGMALIIVLVVLFLLTLVGLAGGDGSHFQALMVRNSQLRLEAFNTSFSEIEFQLEAYQSTAGKAVLYQVIDGEVLSSTGLGPDMESTPVLSIADNDSVFVKEVMLSKVGDCPLFEESIGGYKKCHILRIDSGSSQLNSNIRSDQSQQFSFFTF